MNDLKKTGIVTFWDLPDKLYIFLNRNFRDNLFKDIKNLNLTWEKISEKTKIPKHFLIKTNHKKNLAINLIYLKKLLQFLLDNNINYYFKDIEKNILGIRCMNGKTIYNPKLPFDFTTPQAIRLILALYHDGGIANNYTIHYTNSIKERVEKIINCIKYVFGDINCKIRKETRKDRIKPKFSISASHCLGIILEKIGIPKGEKLMINPKFPKFVFNLPEKVICEGLQQAFDDEGFFIKRNLGMEISTMHNHNICNILEGNKKLLEKIGIKCNKIKIKKIYVNQENIKRIQWSLLITHFNNIKLFKDKINFTINNKIKNLNLYLNNHKQNQTEHGKSLNMALESIKKLISKNIFVNKNILAKELNRSEGRASLILTKLKRKGLIEISKKGIYKIDEKGLFIGHEPNQYKLIEK